MLNKATPKETERSQQKLALLDFQTNLKKRTKQYLRKEYDVHELVTILMAADQNSGDAERKYGARVIEILDQFREAAQTVINNPERINRPKKKAEEQSKPAEDAPTNYKTWSSSQKLAFLALVHSVEKEGNDAINRLCIEHKVPVGECRTWMERELKIQGEAELESVMKILPKLKLPENPATWSEEQIKTFVSFCKQHVHVLVHEERILAVVLTQFGVDSEEYAQWRIIVAEEEGRISAPIEVKIDTESVPMKINRPTRVAKPTVDETTRQQWFARVFQEFSNMPQELTYAEAVEGALQEFGWTTYEAVTRLLRRHPETSFSREDLLQIAQAALPKAIESYNEHNDRNLAKFIFWKVYAAISRVHVNSHPAADTALPWAKEQGIDVGNRYDFVGVMIERNIDYLYEKIVGPYGTNIASEVGKTWKILKAKRLIYKEFKTILKECNFRGYVDSEDDFIYGIERSIALNVDDVVSLRFKE